MTENNTHRNPKGAPFLMRLLSPKARREPKPVLEPNLPAEEILVNMGPQHPSTHGVLRLLVKTDGEWVHETTPYIGYLHRCFEKIGESVTYQQVVPYTDRLDYLASMNNGQAFCMAVEKLLGVEMPPRAEYCRVIAAELNRIASHLLAFGTFGLDIGAFTPLFHAFREREQVVTILEKMSGARLLYHYVRIGGVLSDINEEIAGDIHKVCDVLDKAWVDYNQLLTYNDIFVRRCANVGVLTRDSAIACGCSGPMARGSGVDWDLRRDQPYSAYPDFEFEVARPREDVGVIGDSWQRHWIRIFEIKESIRIVRQALENLPEGPIMGDVKKVIKTPPGEVYVGLENPRGELGFYLISDGSTVPYRCRVRAPSFCNLSVIPELARECLLADVVAIVGSIDVVLGEVDR